MTEAAPFGGGTAVPLFGGTVLHVNESQRVGWMKVPREAYAICKEVLLSCSMACCFGVSTLALNAVIDHDPDKANTQVLTSDHKLSVDLI